MEPHHNHNSVKESARHMDTSVPMMHSDDHGRPHEGHDHHKMMIIDFKRRFFVVLLLTIPVLVLSSVIQQFIGVH